jgi:hypothetical protein
MLKRIELPKLTGDCSGLWGNCSGLTIDYIFVIVIVRDTRHG